MIRQSVLSFKIEKTRDIMTSQAGLALVGELAIGAGLLEEADRQLPKPGSGAGYKASEYLFALLLMLNGGGRSLEDLRQIREDEGLREVLGLTMIPSGDATGDWLRRMGIGGGLEGLEKVNQKLLNCLMRDDGIEGYTLDIDATGIEAEKQEARMTYKGYRGYMPIVGHLEENGAVVGDEFRGGNESPGARNLEFIKYCVKQMPEGRKIGALRADSASYQAKVINYCEEEGIQYAIGADIDEAVKKAIKAIPEGEWAPYQGGHIAQTVHCMDKTVKAFRLVVVRRPYQKGLFGNEEDRIRYKAIATNKGGDEAEVLGWYNQRGQSSENRIKELKIGFGMERMPCGQFEANSIFFRIGILAYNLYRLFVLKGLDRSWEKHQVQTVRWRLYEVAGKIVFHAGEVFLKIKRSVLEVFKDIRLRVWEFANT